MSTPVAPKPGALSTLLDRMLVPGMAGFTRVGYALRQPFWSDRDLDLEGREVVLTGATSGLGLAAAQRLATLGASLTLVGRNRDKLAGVRAQLAEIAPAATVREEVADLTSLRETAALADRLASRQSPIHVLINNAGALFNERALTREGLEQSFALNLASPFLLTNRLLMKLQSGAPARIITVSSGGMYLSKLRAHDLQCERGDYDGTRAYAQAKRGQVVLTGMWARQLADSGVVCHAMHPGWADTPGVEDSLPAFHRLMGPFLRSPEQGADTIVWLAGANRAADTTGGFWFDRAPHVTSLSAKTRETAEDRERLWSSLASICQQIVNEQAA